MFAVCRISELLHGIEYIPWWKTSSSMFLGRKARSRMFADQLIGGRLHDVLSYKNEEHKSVAEHRVMVLAWSVYCYRKRMGHLPVSVEELTAGFDSLSLTDPYRLKPLEIHIAEDQLQVYSRGGNGRDETNPMMPGSGYDHLSQADITAMSGPYDWE